jgi:hypothetical protein
VGQVACEKWQRQHVADYVGLMGAWHRALPPHCAAAPAAGLQQQQEDSAGGLLLEQQQQQWLPIPISLYSRMGEEHKTLLRRVGQGGSSVLTGITNIGCVLWVHDACE